MLKKFKVWRANRFWEKARVRRNKLLRAQEVWLKDRALPFCHRCNGRGHIGFNRSTGFYLDCQCVHRNARKMAKRAFKRMMEQKVLEKKGAVV